MNQGRILALTILFCIAFAIPCRAAVVDEVASDFKPLSGYVVMPVGEGFLIDQDASKGVSVGDLFAVVRVGEKVIHPVTKEVLGTLDEVKGFLQVTRIKSGYSYARPLGKANAFKAGDVIHRYQRIPATFWDYTGQGAGVYAQLKDRLPNLDWQDYAAAQANRPPQPAVTGTTDTALFFVLAPSGLQVHGPDSQVIHAYPRPALPVAESAIAPSGPAAAVPPVTAPVAVAPSPSAPGSVKWEQATVAANQGAAGYQVVYPGFKTVAGLPAGTIMATFYRTGEQLLLATTDGGTFQVFSVSDTLTPLAQGKSSLPGKVLALHWWQPVAGGPLYLALTSSVEINEAVTSLTSNTVTGAIFQLQGDRLTPVRERLQYILGSFDVDGDGIQETLLGQNFDRDIFFGGQLKELRLVNGEVETSSVGLDLPFGFPVQGSLLADLTGDGRPEAIFVRRRTLSVYDGDKLLYESPQQMGGTLSAMTFNRQLDVKDPLFATEPFEVAPVTADLDGDGRLELIAVASEGAFLRAPGMGPNVKSAWLSVLRFNQGTFLRGRLGHDLETLISGLAVSEGRALLVSTQKGSFLSGAGKSHLLELPLGQ